MLNYDISDHNPNKIAVIENENQFTYSELEYRIFILARYFNDRLLTGRNIVLLLRKGIDIVCCYFSCLKVGVVAVPLNYKVTIFELEYYLSYFKANVLLVHNSDIIRLKSSLSNFEFNKIISIEEIIEDGFSKLNFSDSNKLPHLKFPPTWPSIIFQTSGSTDHPKGVVYSHYSLYHSIKPFFSKMFVRRFGIERDKLVYLNCAQISDTVGCIHALWTLMAGGTMIILDKFDANQYISALDQHKPTHSTLFLPHAIQLLNRPSISPKYFKNFKMLCFAGDKTPTKLIEKCLKKTGVHPMIGFGLTESFVVTLNMSKLRKKLGSIGTPVENVEIRIIDENLNQVGDGQVGEIIIRSPQNMVGYWENPGETERVIINGNWLRTGDLGYFDKDQFLWFVGRRKQIIIRGGENISPLEIEEVLQKHPGIKMAGVIGIPHGIEGEVPKAFIVLNTGWKLSMEEMNSYLADRLIYYKVPSEIQFVDSLPLLRTGKLDRKKLRDKQF